MELTRENAKEAKAEAEALFKGIPKTKQLGYIGALNTVLVFIEAAERTLPKEEPKADGLPPLFPDLRR
jgi:hypothetical protein